MKSGETVFVKAKLIERHEGRIGIYNTVEIVEEPKHKIVLNIPELYIRLDKPKVEIMLKMLDNKYQDMIKDCSYDDRVLISQIFKEFVETIRFYQ